MKPIDWIERVDALIARFEQVLLVVATDAIAAIMMAQVVLRSFFAAPLFWAEEIAAQLLVVASLFGLALLLRERQWVAIDFLANALGPTARRALAVALGLITFALLAVFALLAWRWIGQPEVRIERAATTQLPRWWNYAVLPVALVGMLWHQAVLIVKDLAGRSHP
ncbi:MAG: TRAP transporter small permease [Burkholderiales bacterium]|nr:TRAP transporter small permease [Burkholderiales bacterium]